MKKLFLLAIVALLSPTLTSCVFMGGGKKVKIDERQRLRVEFENTRAAHDFHDGMRLSGKDAYIDQGGFLFALTIGAGSATFHETAHYNAQVRLADIDRDSVITEVEAGEYRRYVASRTQD